MLNVENLPDIDFIGNSMLFLELTSAFGRITEG